MEKIIVVGSANTDMVVKTDKLPLPGETKLGGTFLMNAGGKGANQAVAAARMGGNVTFVAKVGNDIFGKQTIEGLKKENIDISCLSVDQETPSGVALIMVNEEGENSIVVAPGANSRLLPGDFKNAGLTGETEIILMQLEIPLETISAVASQAKASGKKVIINPAPAQSLNDELMNGLFLITPNETEASILTGIKVTDKISASKAAEKLLRKGVQNVIITLGKKGAYFQNDAMQFTISAPVVKAIDTTAAGDTFNGALAVAISEKMNWKQAVKFAVTAASVSVTRIGAQSSVPYRKEITLS